MAFSAKSLNAFLGLHWAYELKCEAYFDFEILWNITSSAPSEVFFRSRSYPLFIET